MVLEQGRMEKKKAAAQAASSEMWGEGGMGGRMMGGGGSSSSSSGGGGGEEVDEEEEGEEEWRIKNPLHPLFGVDKGPADFSMTPFAPDDQFFKLTIEAIRRGLDDQSKSV